ncbi:MAG: threonine--tRNA ligase [Actinobacteria bacterium]|nr:MAG: threonine--tRNA ligase [Actinomycetota bacterium]
MVGWFQRGLSILPDPRLVRVEQLSIDLEYPDGSVVQHPDGVTGREVAESIGPGLARAAVAVKVDGELRDLERPIGGSGSFAVITLADDDGLHILRHSSAHVLAQAVLDLYPGSTFAIGPAIEDGFYYDFKVDEPFTPEDLERIESRMKEIIEEDQPFVRDSVSVDNALEIFSDHQFKREIIADVDPSEVSPGEDVTLYRNDGFVDLCRGPHLPSTGRIPAVKLTKTSGAYWRGDQARDQLQRVYGTAWPSQKDLEEYLVRQEEAEKRDHRKLGNELDLFSFPEELGPGLAVWHPKGGMLRKVIEDRSRQMHEKYGFEFVFSPHLAKADLWETSGHLGYYAENMYPGMELDNDQEYRVKPMNCPGHVLIYKSRARSYRDLPIRLSELGGVYRYEKSGVVHGLLRSRGFTQDDSHTFCTEDQLDSELRMHLDFVVAWLRDSGFEEFEADLSTQPAKSVGEQSRWDFSEKTLGAVLDSSGIPYKVAEGEGAFYGPKIDLHVRDAIGRRWQLSTIQLDFTLPERFELEYTSADNTSEQPYMIHCAKAGSLERYMGVLIEHHAGAFPAWMAPVQVTIVPVADRHVGYGSEVRALLEGRGLRVELDESGDTVGDKIRKAITQKHPAVIVVGDNDVEARTVGLRMYGEDRDTRGVPLTEAVDRLAEMAEAPPL